MLCLMLFIINISPKYCSTTTRRDTGFDVPLKRIGPLPLWNLHRVASASCQYKLSMFFGWSLTQKKAGYKNLQIYKCFLTPAVLPVSNGTQFIDNSQWGFLYRTLFNWPVKNEFNGSRFWGQFVPIRKFIYLWFHQFSFPKLGAKELNPLSTRTGNNGAWSSDH